MCNCFDLKDNPATKYCDNRKSVVIKENKVSFGANNPKKRCLCQVHIDGGLITDTTVKKCDYMLVDCSNKEVYFIELKGNHVKQAWLQLEATIDSPEVLDIIKQSIKKYAYIVAARVPKTEDSEEAQIKRKLKKLGYVPRVESQTLEVTID